MIEINVGHTTEFLVLVTAIGATILSGLYRWRIAGRDRMQQLRLDGFRGAVPAQAGGAPWYRQIGSSIAASPLIGIVEQQRLLKLLTAAGIKGRSNLANFIAMKVSDAIVLAGVAWMALELGHLFANIMLVRLAMLGAALIVGWRLPDFILGHMIKRRRLRLEAGIPDALDAQDHRRADDHQQARQDENHHWNCQ